MARRRQINQAEIVRSFAERLRQTRLARGMTQAAVAAAASVPASYVSDLEQAKVAPGIDLVARLADALGTTVTDLLATGESGAGVDPREQLRAAVDGLLRDADPDVVSAMADMVGLLRELTARRR